MRYSFTIPEIVAEAMASANTTIAKIRAIEKERQDEFLMPWFTPRQYTIGKGKSAGYYGDDPLVVTKIKMFGAGITVIVTVMTQHHHEERSWHSTLRVTVEYRGAKWQWRGGRAERSRKNWSRPIQLCTRPRYHSAEKKVIYKNRKRVMVATLQDLLQG